MDIDAPSELQPAMRVSGRGVVIALLMFGTAATSLLWIYWTLHTGPFRPLQDALAAAFPGSSPRVEGGQRKMHKKTPRVLRATLRVDFDPVTETGRDQRVVDRVQEIAGQHVDLAAYDELQVFLFQGVPEKSLRQIELIRNLRPASGGRASLRPNRSEMER